MRAYDIRITDPSTGKLWTPPNLAAMGNGSSFSSFPNSQPGSVPLTAALNIELDIQVASFADPAGGSLIEISGIGWQEISQASNINGFDIQVSAGMAKGLPLASADFAQGQYGIIAQGSIYQAYGNWIGAVQTLDLHLQPPMGTNKAPANLVFNWPAGQPLAQSLQNTLETAFKSQGYTVSVNISPNLVTPQPQVGFHYTLQQFAAYIKKMTAALLGGTYRGVDIWVQGTKIIVSDGTVKQAVKPINYYDLIGQPTWLDDATIQFKCPMRADIQNTDYISFPVSNGQAATLFTSGPNTPSPFTNPQLTFQGDFRVINTRHVGNLREPSADSWVTVFDCTTLDVVNATMYGGTALSASAQGSS